MTSLYGPGQDTGASATPSGSRASMEPASSLHPTGFDPSRDVFAISNSACFYPEEDDPENFDGSMITWTFAAPKDTHTGSGIYRLQFVRVLTPEERGNPGKQLTAIATEARRAETVKQGSVHEGAGPKDIAQSQPLGNPLDTGDGK